MTTTDTAWRHPWLSLGIVLVGSFMALLDTTIVNVALPSMQRDLQADSSSVAWVVSGYTLAFGLTLALAGRLGDTVGRKTMFLTGVALFTLTSALCGAAQSASELVLARVFQGVGAGCFLPQISATIQALFQGHDRGRALGLLGTVTGISTAIGPLAGGLMLRFLPASLGWRSVFLVNIPIGIVGLIAAWRFVQESKDDTVGSSLDPFGLVLLTVGLLCVELPLTEGQSLGWPLWTFVLLAACGPFLGAFIYWERRQEAGNGTPLMLMSLLANRSFATNGVLAIAYAAGFSSLFYSFTIFWQEGLQHSPLDSGLTIAAFALAGLIMSARSDVLTDRFGHRILVIGSALLLVGFVSLAATVSIVGRNINGFELFIPLFIAGLGNGMVSAPNQRFVLAGIPNEMASVGGAAIQTAQRVGTAIGISALGTVLYSSLHVVGRGPHAQANAFVHAFTMATMLNVIAIAFALFVAFKVPKPDIELRPTDT